MKKSMFITLLLAVVMIIAMVGNVNAAEVKASVPELKEGEIVTVTVHTDKPTTAIQFRLTYDESKFEYVEGSANAGGLTTGNVNSTTAGKIVVALTNDDPEVTTQDCTLQFKALKATEGVDFTASGLVTDADEALEPAAVSVKVVANPAVVPGDTPSENEGSGTGATNGNTIDRIPQTGAPVFAVVMTLTVIAIVALAVRKISK